MALTWVIILLPGKIYLPGILSFAILNGRRVRGDAVAGLGFFTGIFLKGHLCRNKSERIANYSYKTAEGGNLFCIEPVGQ